MFIDKVKIFIKAGNGGDGAVAFHTEKFVPNGGPDGGDGGKGGNVVFVADKNVDTLNEFHFQKHFRAGSGEKGGGKCCYGKQGSDIVVRVPVGTVVTDAETGNVVYDFHSDGETRIVLYGGRGGRGNSHFANSRRQSPSFAQNGVKQEERTVILELKTIADVGLVGFPNVGKSTLLSVISEAKPKIANYHFTTLSPNLGVVKYFDSSFVVADIPGLIEGASDGLGLGHEFLRHVERTRMLVHVLDISGSEHRDPLSDFALINKELANYNKDLTKLPQIVVANKMDMPDAEANLARFKAKYGKKYVIVPMMAAIHEGVDQLLSEIIKIYANLPPVVYQEYEPYQFYKEDATQYEITKIDGGVYEVTGGFVNSLARKVSLDDVDSFRYFQRAIAEKGIIDALRLKGARDGDVIIMGDVEFDFID